jgi:C4-dicarboxylate-specific signal transduction histidine kinase
VNAYHRLVREQRDAARSMAQNLKGQVVEAERLATLGTFAASVCHELNNIGTVMAATLELLERDPASLDASKLGSLHHVSSHIHALSRAVLKIARPQRSPATVTTDLREVVRDVEEMTRVTGRTRHLVLEVVAPDRPMPVLVTSVHAQQVLLNLIVNAADALAGRDDPRLRIELIAGASHVACVVKDNGCGMTPDVLARVFEPFFTTKPVGTGTGLGMPVVQHLVDAWGGALAIQTAPGEGTTVRVTIPRDC